MSVNVEVGKLNCLWLVLSFDSYLIIKGDPRCVQSKCLVDYRVFFVQLCLYTLAPILPCSLSSQMARMLAAKASLAIRVDALGEDSSIEMGTDHRAKLEIKLRLLEEGNLRRLSGTTKAKVKLEKYHGKR